MKKNVCTNILPFLMVLALSGCATLENVLVQEKFPSIAHTHIGHSITGWMFTPEKKGLFQIAEQEAKIAQQHAEYAMERLDNLDLIKLHVRHVMHAVDPASHKGGPGLGFGVKRAVAEAANHITFAAESDDASENVRNFAEPFTKNTEAVVQRCDLILALAQEILATASAQEAAALAGEILNLTRANVEGVDSSGNGTIGPDPGEYGLKQLRAQITDMVNREDPPYHPVAQRYLFGLIRLSSGKWAFDNSLKSDDFEGSGGGGY